MFIGKHELNLFFFYQWRVWNFIDDGNRPSKKYVFRSLDLKLFFGLGGGGGKGGVAWGGRGFDLLSDGCAFIGNKLETIRYYFGKERSVVCFPRNVFGWKTN